MTDAQAGPQPSPQTLVQVGGRVAEGLVGSLGTQPVFLALVVLNMVFAGSAAWFLLKQDEYRFANQREMISLMRACILETDPVPAPVAAPPP